MTLLSRRLLPFLLAPALRLLAERRAWAAPLQEPESNALADWMTAQWNTLFIEGMKAAATLFWFLEKGAAGITRFLMNQDIWSLVLQSALGSLAHFMPEVLRRLIFAAHGGAGGILYLALMLAGLLLIVPNLGSARLVDPARVVLWALVVSTLFISATSGYDLIGAIERMRNRAAQTVIQLAGETGDLDTLVATPLMAGPEDLQNYSFVLPETFEREYFPEATGYEEREVFSFSGVLTWSWTIRVETEQSQQARRERAQTGLAIAGLTLLAGWVLLAFGVVFATLTAAALLLIIFFIVGLPLGFFEFGASILSGLIKQYAYLFAVTLLAVALAGVLAQAGLTAWQGNVPPGPSDMMAFIPILLIVAIAMSYVASMATHAMTATFGIVSTSIRHSMSPLIYAGSLPAAGGIPGSELVAGAFGTAAAGSAALATGGMGAALLAVGGTALSNLNGGMGRDAARVALARGGGDGTHVFAAAARGLGTPGVLSQTLRQRRRDHRVAASAFDGAHTNESRRPAAAWGAIDAGAFHTTDMRHLQAAGTAYRAERTVEARQHLERAFGSREVAERVLALYHREGEGGEQRVRAIVEATQTVAAGMAREGMNLFDHEGRATPTFTRNLQEELEARALYDRRDAAEAALVGQIAGATVRQPVGIWSAPDAARKLALETLYPLGTSEVMAGDLPAQYRLHDLAARHGWGEAQLEVLFEATRLGQGGAATGRRPIEALTALLREQGEWQQTPETLLGEAARLALLVVGDAQAQRGTTLELPVPPPAPSPPQSERSPVPPENQAALEAAETAIPAPPAAATREERSA